MFGSTGFDSEPDWFQDNHWQGLHPSSSRADCCGIDFGFEDGEGNHHGCVDHFRVLPGTISTMNYEVASPMSSQIKCFDSCYTWSGDQEANYSVTNAVLDSCFWDNQANRDFHSLPSSHSLTLPYSFSNDLWMENPYPSEPFIPFSPVMEKTYLLYPDVQNDIFESVQTETYNCCDLSYFPPTLAPSVNLDTYDSALTRNQPIGATLAPSLPEIKPLPFNSGQSRALPEILYDNICAESNHAHAPPNAESLLKGVTNPYYNTSDQTQAAVKDQR